MATADETTLNSGSGGSEVDTVDIATSPTIQRQVVAVGDPNTRANYGVVTTNGNLGVVRSSDRGRTFINFTVDFIAGVAAMGLAPFELDSGGTTSGTTSFTVPAGTVFRIQSLDLAVKLTSTVVNNSRVYIVGTSSGSAATTSPILDYLVAAPAIAATNAVGWVGTDVPDGIDIPAGWNIAIAHIETATTCSVSLSLNGFLYAGQ